jgi:hypothetical protein
MIHRLRSIFLVGLIVSIGVAGAGRKARGGIVVGSWDTTRAGAGSVASGSLYTDLHNDILATFPGSSFVSMPTLTAANLAGVQVLMIGSGTGDTTDTTALSASEQSALLTFVQNGGSAIISVDNDTFAGGGTSAVNNSYISPFGLHVTGTGSGIQLATATNTSSPVTNGPFGLVSSIQTSFPGWFDNLGSNAQSLATLNFNSQPMLAVINRGALGAGSGGVVFYSDSILINVEYSTANNQTLARNSLAFASATVPEPSSLVLAGAAVLVAGAFTYRQRRARLD